jgi:hypothetical protein
MISLILYGRNDNYGYNLHKRVAISINAFAEVLSENDEILFCDYNTPNSLPVFPCAIHDTLTKKAKKLLRIFRVRPEVHEKYYGNGKSPLKVVEPLARNVAIRRASEKSKWILNSNTDIVALTSSGREMSIQLQGFSHKHGVAPRFELPESVWDEFDRGSPKQFMKHLSHHRSSPLFKEIVVGDDWNLFDAPGDFQLVGNAEMQKIQGFDENMCFGWHCDSNLNMRLKMAFGPPGDLSSYVECYHCSHTRVVTPMHSSNSGFNDPDKFIHNLDTPIANENWEWGLGEEEVEELHLTPANLTCFTSTVSNLITEPDEVPATSSYRMETYESEGMSDKGVSVYLFNELVNFPKTSKIHWIGRYGELGQLCQSYLEQNHFIYPIQMLSSQKPNTLPDILIISFFAPFADFEYKNKKIVSELSAITKNITRLINKENLSSNLSVKILIVGSMHTRYENLINSSFDCSRSGFSTRLTAGFISSKTRFNMAEVQKSALKQRARNIILQKRHRWPNVYMSIRAVYRFVKAIRKIF